MLNPQTNLLWKLLAALPKNKVHGVKCQIAGPETLFPSLPNAATNAVHVLDVALLSLTLSTLLPSFHWAAFVCVCVCRVLAMSSLSICMLPGICIGIELHFALACLPMQGGLY